MSNPDEIQNPAGEARASQQSIDQPMDMPTAIGQLRSLVCGLGVGLLVVSLALSAFVYKQNRNLSGDIHLRQQQIAQLRVNRQQITYVLNELAKYSNGKPELVALFAKHGMQLAPPATTGTEPASPATPQSP